jgi:uncharacterized protein YceK
MTTSADFIDPLTPMRIGWRSSSCLMRGFSALGIALSMIVLTGCGTTMNVRDSYRAPPPPGEISIIQSGHQEAPKLIYGGVVMDTLFGVGMLFSESQNDIAAGPIGLYTLAVDLPLSIVGDTLTLPVTIPATLERRKNAIAAAKDSDSSEFNPSDGVASDVRQTSLETEAK